MNTDKKILDACCGSRMFWFDKSNEDVLFMDIRMEDHVLCDGRDLKISPDVVADFRAMPFYNDSFRLVIFDPPHIENLGPESWMGKKYGRLTADWKEDLKKGFEECFRVLEPFGILIFKWNEDRIKVSEILKLTHRKPLIGHKSGKQQKTHWITFIKN